MGFFKRLFFGKNVDHVAFREMGSGRSNRNKRSAYAAEKVEEYRARRERANSKVLKGSSGRVRDMVIAEAYRCFILTHVYLALSQEPAISAKALDARLLQRFMDWLPVPSDITTSAWKAMFNELREDPIVVATFPSAFDGTLVREWEVEGAERHKELLANQAHDAPIISEIEALRSRMRQTRAFLVQSTDPLSRMQLVTSMDAMAQGIARWKQRLRTAIPNDSIDEVRG